MDVVELLLRAGADRDKAKETGATPLFIASLGGRKDVVELLLQAGADLDKSAKNGFTPLFAASHTGHKGIAKLLRQAGADENKSLLLHHLPDYILSPESLQTIIANNFKAIKRHRPPLANLQHSAIHMAIVLLDNHPATALPVAQQILSTFPRDHPTLPLLEARVHQLTHEQSPARGPEHLPEELRALMIAELIDEDQLPKKKKGKKKK